MKDAPAYDQIIQGLSGMIASRATSVVHRASRLSSGRHYRHYCRIGNYERLGAKSKHGEGRARRIEVGFCTGDDGLGGSNYLIAGHEPHPIGTITLPLRHPDVYDRKRFAQFAANKRNIFRRSPKRLVARIDRRRRFGAREARKQNRAV